MSDEFNEKINKFLDEIWDKLIEFRKNGTEPKFIYLGYEETYLVHSSKEFQRSNYLHSLTDKKTLWGFTLIKVYEQSHFNITGQ